MQIELQGQDIILRPLQETFVEPYLHKFSVPVMAALHLQSSESERMYLHNALEQQRLGATHFYCIFNKKSDELIGALEIRNPDFSRGQLYTWIHQNYWGQGLFQQALTIAAQDYFTKTKSLYFDATVDMTNMRSYKALKKIGFADIGIQEGAHGKQFVLIYRNKNNIT